MATDIKSYLQTQLKRSVSTYEYGKKVIWFDKPYLLYLEDSQSQAYLEMINAEKFANNLHEPTQRLIEMYSKDILKDFKGPLEFYDLGPGLPKKTIPLLKELQKREVDFKYIPVDISNYFLEITSNEIKKIGVESNGIKTYFEDLHKFIDTQNKIERLYFIGLTFNNYRPDKILSILKKLSKAYGTCLLITEYFSSKNIQTILSPYKDRYAEWFNFQLMSIVGFNKDEVRYFTNFKNQRIEMGFELLEDTHIDSLTFRKGTKIVTAVSYRYSRRSITNYISKYFHHFEYFEDEDRYLNLVAFKLFSK